MTDNLGTQREPIIAYLDGFIFLKNGYSFFKHLVPFMISALILLTLSVPADNLLLKLVKLLQTPSWIWLPAGLLTAGCTVVYMVMINIQIRKAYLWSDRDLCRTIGTSLIYILLCALMAYAVLSFASSAGITWGNIWACFLVAVLSFTTGIGWKGPEWVESIGIKSPDYTEGRLAAEKTWESLQHTRNEEVSEERDVKDYLEVVKKLRASIETNLHGEPKWAKGKLESASGVLLTLQEQIDSNFIKGGMSAIGDFAAACRYQKDFKYREFIEALKQINLYWREWTYEDSHERSV
jgi:hypothetical protein